MFQDGTFMAVKTLSLEKMDASEGANRHDSLEQDMNFMSKLVTFNYSLHFKIVYITPPSDLAIFLTIQCFLTGATIQTLWLVR